MAKKKTGSKKAHKRTAQKTKSSISKKPSPKQNENKIKDNKFPQEQTTEDTPCTDYAAYLAKLKSLREKKQFDISKDTVLEELLKRKEAKINNRLHCRGEAQGLLFFPQAKELTNWVLLQNAHTFQEKMVKYNVFVHKTKISEQKIKMILCSPGCVDVSAAEIGPVENKGIIYDNEKQLSAKIWCGTTSKVNFRFY